MATEQQRAFVVAAIKAIGDVQESEGMTRKDGKKLGRGVHVVYSGFNDEFKRRFSEASKDTTDEMVGDGSIVLRGLTMYLPEDAPAATGKDKAVNALRSISI